MPRIAFIARYPRIGYAAAEVARQMRLDVTIRLATHDTCVDEALALLQGGHELIVIRAGLYDVVAEALPRLAGSFVRCSGSTGEHLSYLSRAKSMASVPHPTICSVACTPYPYQDELSRILDAEIVTIPAKPLEEIDRDLQKLLDCREIHVLTTRTEYAEHLKWAGLPVCPHESPLNVESIAIALQTAAGMLAAIDMQKKDVEELSNLLRYSFDAILFIDHGGVIELCNIAAESLLGFNQDFARGKPLWEILPMLTREEVMAVLDGDEMIGHLVTIERQEYVVNGAAFSIFGKLWGASFYFKTLEKMEAIENGLRSELTAKGQRARFTFQDIIGDSPKILHTKLYAQRFARCDSTVLLFGETGTGKELFAQSIHNASGRKDGPFIAVNCAALPETLLESELFGYAEGAFTGATKRGKRGLFEAANGGTLFLDEISEMNYSGQTKLLRVLAERCVTRVGDDIVRPVNVRIIAATNRQLDDLVEEGVFRSDLYYRLNVLSLQIPPLRERPSDIPLIFDHYLHQYAKSARRHISIAPDVPPLLCTYPWPGNVRQLKNFCERLIVISDRQTVSADMVEEQIASIFPGPHPARPGRGASEERQIIEAALRANGGSRAKTAAALGISASTLWRKMKKYTIQ